MVNLTLCTTVMRTENLEWLREHGFNVPALILIDSLLCRRGWGYYRLELPAPGPRSDHFPFGPPMLVGRKGERRSVWDDYAVRQMAEIQRRNGDLGVIQWVGRRPIDELFTEFFDGEWAELKKEWEMEKAPLPERIKGWQTKLEAAYLREFRHQLEQRVTELEEKLAGYEKLVARVEALEADTP